jgi:hypothetical protein
MNNPFVTFEGKIIGSEDSNRIETMEGISLGLGNISDTQLNTPSLQHEYERMKTKTLLNDKTASLLAVSESNLIPEL